jgi:hypothetical protein
VEALCQRASPKLLYFVRLYKSIYLGLISSHFLATNGERKRFVQRVSSAGDTQVQRGPVQGQHDAPHDFGRRHEGVLGLLPVARLSGARQSLLKVKLNRERVFCFAYSRMHSYKSIKIG